MPCSRELTSRNLCFVALPTKKYANVKEVIKEILKEMNIHPHFAVDIKRPGEDIFCSSICGPIIESAFCIVVSDANRRKGNVNVAFEHGMMASLNKYIIILHEDKFTSPFDLYTLQAIKYDRDNLDDAFRNELTETIKSVISRLVEMVEDREVSQIPEKDYELIQTIIESIRNSPADLLDTNFNNLSHMIWPYQHIKLDFVMELLYEYICMDIDESSLTEILTMLYQLSMRLGSLSLDFPDVVIEKIIEYALDEKYNSSIRNQALSILMSLDDKRSYAAFIKLINQMVDEKEFQNLHLKNFLGQSSSYPLLNINRTILYRDLNDIIKSEDSPDHSKRNARKILREMRFRS